MKAVAEKIARKEITNRCLKNAIVKDAKKFQEKLA